MTVMTVLLKIGFETLPQTEVSALVEKACEAADSLVLWCLRRCRQMSKKPTVSVKLAMKKVHMTFETVKERLRRLTRDDLTSTDVCNTRFLNVIESVA